MTMRGLALPGRAAGLPIGTTAFDPLLGYRGTHSVVYPGLSTVDALARTVGQGHRELAPRDSRPLRQLVDEIAWLMGIQFVVQVVAASGEGFLDVPAARIPSLITVERPSTITG